MSFSDHLYPSATLETQSTVTEGGTLPIKSLFISSTSLCGPFSSSPLIPTCRCVRMAFGRELTDQERSLLGLASRIAESIPIVVDESRDIKVLCFDLENAFGDGWIKSKPSFSNPSRNLTKIFMQEPIQTSSDLQRLATKRESTQLFAPWLERDSKVVVEVVIFILLRFFWRLFELKLERIVYLRPRRRGISQRSTQAHKFRRTVGRRRAEKSPVRYDLPFVLWLRSPLYCLGWRSPSS